MFHRPSLLDKFGVYLFRSLWIGVLGCLLARTGNWLIIQPLAAAPAASTLTFQLVDNFDSSALGALNGQNGWQATTGIHVVGDPVNALNHVVEVTASGTQAYKALPTAISNLNTGTLHFRLRRNGHIDGFAGLSDLAAPTDWSSYETQLGAQSIHAADEFIVRDSSQFDVLGNQFADQTWYCVWLVTNNAADSYQVYAQGGAFTTPTQLDAAGQTTFSFRNGGSDALLTFLARMDTAKSQGSFYLDDIYVDPTSQNLAAPGNDCNPIVATVGWQPTALTLQAGEQFNIVYTGGTWTVDARSLPYAGPDGYSLDVDSGIHAGCKVDTASPYAMLLGQVGGGAIFSVGLGGTFTSDASGALAFRINDQDWCLGDNAGSIGLLLTRVQIPAPSANFDAWPQSGGAPLTVAMHIVSTDNLTSCDWEYGDGAKGNACTPYHNHTYTTPGSYTVKLTVAGPGGTDSMTRANYIMVAAPAVPTVQFGAATYAISENSGSALIQVTLNQATSQTVFVSYATSNGTATAGSDYTTTSGTLTFGAGQTSATFTVPILDDTIDEANQETVNLSLSSPTNATLGAPATAILSISDNDEPAPAGPTANFSANPTTGAKPLLVNFIDQSTGSITSWAWNFGDGGTSTQQSPTHTYNTAGDFTVLLTVSGPNGANTKTIPSYIHVSEPLPASPAASAIDNADQNGSYVVIWSASTNATGYELQEQQNSGAWATIYTGPNTSHTLAGKADGVWCYRVRATNASGSSNWSNTQCATVSTPLNLPATPALSTIANQDGDSNYVVNWSSSAGATTYELQERFNGGSWATIYTGAATSYNLTGKTGGEWCYQVRATNAGGSSGWSTPHCVTIPAGTAQPSLSLPNQAAAAPGSAVTLRITYDANTNNISSLLFSVDYDQTKLTADSNGDGAPDAITFRSDLPASMIKAVTFDASDTDGELDFTIADFAASPQALPSGVIAEITLQVLATTTPPTEAPVQFAVASFGSSTGDITGITKNGSVSIVARSPALFLPLIRR